METSFFAKYLCGENTILFDLVYRKVSCSCNPEGVIASGLFIVKSNGDAMIVEKQFLSKKLVDPELLVEFLSDCNTITDKYGKKKIYYNNVPQIIEEYNKCIADK